MTRPSDEATLEPASREGAPSIAVLATGGTIAQSGSREATIGIAGLVSALPHDASRPDLLCEQVFQVVSPDITPDHWLMLARRINELAERDDIAGIVVTHGTDTLEETAYFLNLVVRTDKPVVVVGSMRSADRDGADGPSNLRGAIAVAATADAGGRGVLVTLNDRIESARDVTKLHTSALDAFRSPDSGPLGILAGDRVRFDRATLRRHTRSSAFSGLDRSELPRVDIAYLYAGVGREALDAAAGAGAAGIVLAGTGNGSIPIGLREAIGDLRRAGIVVVRSSRTNGGVVTRNGEVDDDLLGLVAADSLNPQKARVLLMLALDTTRDVAAIQGMFDDH